MLQFLINKSRGLLLTTALTSVLNGVCSVLLLAQISHALTADQAARQGMVWVFALTALAMMICHMVSSILSERLSHHAYAQMRLYVSQRVMDADYRHLEATGSAKVQSALSEHSANVAEFFVSFPAILTNLAVVLGCLIYMLCLSWSIFLIAVLVLALGSLSYHLVNLRAIGHLDAAAKEQDHLFAHFRSLTDGAKELRLHRGKRQAFTEKVLGASVEKVRRERTQGMSIFVISASWSNFLIYAFIGLVMFVLIQDVPNQAKVMTGFALIFVYMVTPLEILLLNIPRANLAKASADRIEEITQEMPGHEQAASSSQPEPLQRLQLNAAAHRYYHEQSDDFFALGPIDLQFQPGEVVFLVGGNGSGKTTLAKLLVGLYPPEQGEIVFNGVTVDHHNRDQYRQIFSTVFSDFHLFDRLLQAGEGKSDLDERGNQLIARLHLQHKVQVKNGAFTTQALSQGQRKRLALVVAYLEDRPFIVFDEWAADQDPHFKDVFYHEVLAELKAQGKTVLVISHDDRYFHLADRLIRLENGQLSPNDLPKNHEESFLIV
jgi:putative pyoverdin transport system ATP-binding/permease protein